MKFSIKYFFSKCDQTHRKLRIFWHLLKNSLMQNFIFCDVRILVIGDSESGKTDALLNLIKQQDDHVFYFPANNKSI